MNQLTSMIENINRQVDGLALVKLANYHADKIQDGGGTLKCFCPVHQEMAFRSLIINLKGHTFKCMMRRCRCFEGGTFVEFWSIFRGKEQLEAALELADLLKLEIDKASLAKLAQTFGEQARQALEGGRLEEARERIEEALGLDAANGEWRLLSARIWQAAGDPEKALADQLSVLDAMMAGQKYNVARELLARLLMEQGENPDLLERQVALLRQAGETREQVAALLRQADVFQKGKKQEPALAALCEARNLAPDDPALLHRIAALCGGLGRKAERNDALARLCRLYQELGETSSLLETLDERLAESPADIELRSFRAQVLGDDGNAAAARAEWIGVVQLYADGGRLAEAIALVNKLLKEDGDDLELNEKLASLLAAAGEASAVDAYRRLAGLAGAAGLGERVGEYFELARSIDPRNSQLRRDLAEWKLGRGDQDGAINDLFSVAMQSFEERAKDAAKAILERIAELAPDDIDKRIRIGRCLESGGLEADAFASYLDLANGLIAKKHFDAAQAICEETRRLRPLDPLTLELRVAIHLALKQKPLAVEACREAAQAHLANGDVAAAETALQRALKADRGETRAKTDLARLYETSGRKEPAKQLWIEMAMFHRAQQQLTEAQGAVREALRIDPSDVEARVLHAEGLESGGKGAQAREVWQALGRERIAGGNDDSKALGWLRRALDLSPRSVDLLAEVAQATARVESRSAARPAYSRWLGALDAMPPDAETLAAYRLAVENYAEETAWRLRLATLMLDAGLNEEAADHFEILLRSGKRAGDAPDAGRHLILEKLATLRPNSPEMRLELARSFMEIGRAHEAVRLYRDLGDKHVAAGEPKDALALYEEALAKLPDNIELLTQAARLHDAAGDAKRAQARFERLAEMNRRNTDRAANIPVLEKLLSYKPADESLRAELAEAYEADGDLDKAVEHTLALAQAAAGKDAARAIDLCVRIRRLAPDCLPARELLAESRLAKGQIDEAKIEFDELGDLALAAGRIEAAEACFKRIVEIDPDDFGGGERLGKLYEASGKIAEACEAYTRVLAVYEKKDETARAVAVLQKLARIEPADLAIRLRLARALLDVRSDRREAGEVWLGLIEQALAMADDKAFDAAVAESEPLFRKDWAWRLRLAQTIAGHASQARALETWLRLAADASEERNFETARDAAAAGLELDAARDDMRVLRIDANRSLSAYDAAAADLGTLAEACTGTEDFEGAIGWLKQALELTPRDLGLLELLAEAQMAAHLPADARATLHGMAEIHRAENDLTAAIERARRIEQIAPGEETQDYLAGLLDEAGLRDEAFRIWRRAAERCADDGNLEPALFRFARLLELRGGDFDIMRRLADLAYRQGGLAAAQAHYDRLIDALEGAGDDGQFVAECERILEMEPACLSLKERLAEHLITRGRTADAVDKLLETMAAYRDERGQPDDALRILRRLQAIEPENIEVCEQEAVLLENTDRCEEAVAVWRRIAQTHRAGGDPSRAAGCLMHCAQLEADNPRAQLEVAEMFAQDEANAESRERATEYLLRAIDIHDRREEPGPCVEILQRAIAINPARRDLGDALGRVYERLGMIPQATRHWLDLGAACEAADAPQDAVAAYKQVRQLAPEEQDALRRLADLHEKLGERPAALAAIRELARLAAADKDLESEATHLRRAFALDPADESNVLLLADALKRLGADGERFDLLARMERQHCSAGRLDEALQMLGELREMRPDEPELMSRSIELLVKTGRAGIAAQQGIELIQVYFDRRDDQRALETLSHIAEIEPGNIERRISLARLVHANGRHQAAAQEFFLLTSRLFGDDRAADALLVCQPGLELFPDDTRLRDLAGRALLKLGRRDEAVEVQLHLAALLDQRGEDAKAEQVYESILAEQPDHQGTLEAMVEWAQRHDRYGVAVDRLVRLAEMHYVAGALDKAIDAMERIQTIDPRRLDLKARLAEIYLEVGDREGAAATWLAAARGFMNAQAFDDAVSIFEKAFGLDPENIDILEALTEAYACAERIEDHLRTAGQLAHRLAESGDVRRARAVLEDLTRRRPDDPSAWERLAALNRMSGADQAAIDAYCRLGEIHRVGGRLNEAREALENATALAPDRIDLQEGLGDILLALGRRAEGSQLLAAAAQRLADDGENGRARDLCMRILKLDPRSLAVRALLARSLERLGDIAAALEEYRQAARAFADAREHAPAIEILAHVLKLDPERLDERELYAKLLRREGDVAGSVKQWLKIIDAIGGDEDPRRAIKFCRQILDEDPEQPEAHMHLCGIYERTGKLRQAFQECEWLADWHHARGEHAEAETRIRKGLGWLPDELPMRTRLVEMLIAGSRMDEAASELAEIAKQAESRADTRMSRWALKRACEVLPVDMARHGDLADFMERQGELAEARAARMRIVRLLLDRGRMDEARDLAERVVDAAAEDDALRLEVAGMFEQAGLPEVAAYHCNHLARRCLAAERHDEAIRLARRAIELKPRHVGARETLIAILLAKRENNRAAEEYEALFELYDEAGESEGALRTLQSIIDLAPSRPEPRRKLITLYRKMRREEPMIDQLRRLVEIYVNSGDSNNAVECLRDLMAIRPEDTRARTRYIDLYTQVGDERDLMEDYLQLARILSRKGAVVEAMRTYEKMLQLHPASTVCREEFVQFLFEQGQIHRGVEESRALADILLQAGEAREAGRILERSLNYAPDELEMRMKLAEVFLKTNRRGQALETYRSLVRRFEQDGDAKRLADALGQAVAIDPLNAEYRERLADLYFRTNQIDLACEQSLALAEQYGARELFDLAEHEYRRVLAVRADDATLWRRAIDAHLKVGQLSDLLPDLHRLAELCRKNGKLKDAIAVFKQIMACEPDNAAVLQKYIDVYMQIGLEQDLVDDYLRLADLRTRAGDAAEANRIFQHLMTIAPQHAQVREYAGRTQGRPSKGAGATKARTAAKQAAPKPEPAPPAEEAKAAAAVPGDTTRKLIRNYENVLKLNPRNPGAHAKLAELLAHAGDTASAALRWRQSAAQFLEKGDLEGCIEVCDRFLKAKPEDAAMREIRSQAMVQRDSMRAIDGAIGME